jgi:hypothetical protein
VAMNTWLAPELEDGLREVTAPPELWDRVQSARVMRSPESNRRLVWALALSFVLASVALLSLFRWPVRQDSQTVAFQCQNPAQLRAWVKAKTGIDVPLRGDPPASIRLIGARNQGERVEIAYRTGDRDALLLVSRANGAGDVPHSSPAGKVSSWVMNGQRYTLACDNPGDLQLACKLCHLD